MSLEENTYKPGSIKYDLYKDVQRLNGVGHLQEGIFRKKVVIMKFLTIILIIAIACLATNCKRSNVTDDIASIEDYTYNRLFKDISVLSINERYRCDAKEYKVFDISYESDSLTVHTKFIPSTPEFWVCSSVVYDNNCNRIYIPLEEANYELFLRFKENKEKLSSLDNAYDIIEKFNLMGINWVDNPKQYILIDSTGKGHIISK